MQRMWHKRVWPTAQRDSVFVSHYKALSDGRFAVENMSVEHDLAPQVRGQGSGVGGRRRRTNISLGETEYSRLKTNPCAAPPRTSSSG